MNLGSICVRKVDCIMAGQSVLEAADLMKECGTGSLVVVDSSRIPIGILTDRDLAIRVTATELDPRSTTVDSVMTREPVVAAEADTIHEGLTRMRSHGLRRIPIVGGDGRLVGMVSVHDMLHHLMGDLSTLTQVLDQRSRLTDELVCTGDFSIRE